MPLRYFNCQLLVFGAFYLLHGLLILRGFSHVGLFAGFLYLVKPDDIGGVAAITLQVLLFGGMMACHPFVKRRWDAVISGRGALLRCLSGLFNLYALAT
jgi:hypothetical protein